MRPRKTLLYGTAILACGLYAAGAQADPVTVQLFYTTFAGGANVDAVTSVTLSGSTLTFTGNHNIASTAGADGILFLPDGNLAIAGQNANNPAQVHEITTGGIAVTSASTTASSNGSYHLALSSNSSTANLYTLCNGGCGANLTRFTLAGGGLRAPVPTSPSLVGAVKTSGASSSTPTTTSGITELPATAASREPSGRSPSAARLRL